MRIVRSLVLLLFAVMARAQDTAVVEGVVTNSQTGQPINRATVQLSGRAAPVTVTDAAGRFRFTGIPPGRYQVQAERAGFAAGAQRQAVVLNVAAGEARRDVLVQLDPPGVITGSVINEEGEPVVGAKVSVLQREYTGWRRRYVATASANTDDRGQFRLHSLLPGRYVVQVAILRPPTTSELYPVAYYPNATDIERAVPVSLAAGAELRGIDLSVRPVRSARVQGRLLSGESGQPISGGRVVLHPRDAIPNGPTRPARQLQDPPGGFLFEGVGPGSYTLRAEVTVAGRRLLASQPVEVSADLEGLDLTLQPAVRLTGRVSLDEEGPVNLAGTVVALESIEDLNLGGASGKVSPEGTFEILNLAPTRYDLVLYQAPERLYLKGVRLGAQNTVDLTAFGGREIQMDLVFGLDSGTVAGTTTPNGIVALVPPANTPHRKTRYRVARADGEGRFRLVGIAPGDYQLYTFAQVESGAWIDDDFLASLPNRGMAVTFAPREIKAINFLVQ